MTHIGRIAANFGAEIERVADRLREIGRSVAVPCGGAVFSPLSTSSAPKAKASAPSRCERLAQQARDMPFAHAESYLRNDLRQGLPR